ncbi:hypothetical protein [Rahnella aquatilis]|uniref:Uncharacterized protein n=1 Tax=Rahnella aquatilis (strain ATCC 33071 / DSM 4594 / JCM 1683 / NBRC 105701 / NCIMB 13365 / CIP 78.65) TaxID=745277 RepID=H2IVE5_RAHAC|nr:hypothetical protein [Rahnella aquatilis]AEX51732.1 hypothetical protein Rahaq2_1866 [Rahnella aquatilis CIP 78.65 = ATCC 33071]
MKVWKMVLCAAPILLVAGIAYGNFNGGSEPDYVLNAMNEVSNKMSTEYGITKCKSVQHEGVRWSIACSSANTPTALNFTVQPANTAPYDVATPFYLVAKNAAAKKASGEGLLRFMDINTLDNTDDVKQLAIN